MGKLAAGGNIRENNIAGKGEESFRELIAVACAPGDMEFHHLRLVPKQSLLTIMPDATHIGIRQSLKGSLWKEEMIQIIADWMQITGESDRSGKHDNSGVRVLLNST